MRRSITACLAAFTIGVAFVAGSCSGSDDAAATSTTEPIESYSGYVVDPPSEVAAVSLPLADGSGEFSMVAEPGGLEIVYFGYTFCPDVCPTSMSDVRRALAELPEAEAERVGVSVVTVDPARDTPEVIESYVTNFVADGQALRTEDDMVLRSAADAFGANYSVETNAEGDVEVSHTAELYAVDDSGTVVMQWPFGTSYESLARDLRSLLGEAAQN